MRKDIRQLFDEFMYECEFVRKVRPETLRGYTQTFATFVKLLPDMSLELLTPLTITRFFKILQERKRIVGKGIVKIGIKKSTVATYWSKLNTFFEWLEIRKCINENPFRRMVHPSPVYEDKKFLKKEQVEKILNVIHYHHDDNILILKRNLAMFYILLLCGLRREELLLLQIRDIDFERKILTVRGETSKSGKTRQLPLHSIVLLHVKDYLNERKKYSTSHLIVSSTKDVQLSYNGLKHLVAKLRKWSGVRFHLHQFRHTFAVNFLKTSNNIVKLKQLLGHKDIRMTMAYLRCLPTDEMRGDVENMSIENLI